MAMVTDLQSSFSSAFLSSLFSHYVLYQQSPTPSIFCCCSPFSSHSFQTSLNKVLPSPSLSPSPPFSFTFWASDLCQFSISHSFQKNGPFHPTPHHLFLKLSFTPTSTLSSSILLLSALFTPRFFMQLFSQTCTFSCCLEYKTSTICLNYSQ